jgi:ADP-heptose:LPS heptosyltransferase
MGVPEDDFVFDCHDSIGSEPCPEKFDVLMSDGYNWKANGLWEAKSYRYYDKVVKGLSQLGLRIGSIGSKEEAIKGTEDCTGLSLMRTMGLIANAGAVVSNDSGFYHCAAALGRPVVVLFTFTTIRKNHDARFHKTATLLHRKDLPCMADCHARMRWKNCGHQSCRNLPAVQVVDAVVARLGGSE